MKSHVRARLVQDTETLKVSIEVSVRSNIKTNMWCNHKIDADHPRLVQEADRWAQKAAEFQIQRYADKHSAKECGRMAAEAVQDIMRMAERASTRQGVGTSADDLAFEESAQKMKT